jgi:hypothetical protein
MKETSIGLLWFKHLSKRRAKKKDTFALHHWDGQNKASGKFMQK